MSNKCSYVYILSDDRNDKLYVGITSNLIKRINEHREQHVSGYTKKHKIHKLVYYQEFGDIYIAISREKQIKGRLRKRKIKLIELNNPNWDDLYKEITE